MPITTENNRCENDLLEGQVPTHGDVKSVNAIAQPARNRFFFLSNQTSSHSHQAILVLFFFRKMCSNSSSRYSSTLLWLPFDQPASNAQNLKPELIALCAPKTEVNEKPTFQAAPSCWLDTCVSYPQATESISCENRVRGTLWGTPHKIGKCCY